ncbi:VWA domain-containing protein [bacterium]|nr:VWA domain-containing protein [bacterium]
MHLAQPEYLHLLWVLLIIAGLEVYLLYWRRRSLHRFAALKFQSALFPVYSKRLRWFKLGIWFLALAALTVALARPQGKPVLVERPKSTRVSYIVLDCSLSMRAQDIQPSRLLAAKQTIRDIVERRPNDRVGLILFAGEAQVVCPATFDHQAFFNALHYVDTQTLGIPGSFPVQGLQLALEKMAALQDEAKLIILFSDGEEHQAGDLEAIGQAAHTQGVKIVSVGLGTEKGSAIPLGKDFWGKEKYRRYRGKLVETRLVSLGMSKAAKLSGGQYFHWKNSRDTVAAIRETLRKYSRDTQQKAKVLAYYEFFPWLVALAFCLLLLDWLLPMVGRRNTP